MKTLLIIAGTFLFLAAFPASLVFLPLLVCTYFLGEIHANRPTDTEPHQPDEGDRK